MKPQAGEFFIYIEEMRYQKGRHSISNDAVHGVKGGGQGARDMCQFPLVINANSTATLINQSRTAFIVLRFAGCARN